MSRFLRLCLIFLLFLLFIFSLKRSSDISAQKAKISQNNPQKEKIFQIADHLYQPGSGEKIKELFPDLEPTSFDPIGKGEGPIDYLYSASANTTFLKFHYPNIVIGLENGRVVYSGNNKYN